MLNFSHYSILTVAITSLCLSGCDLANKAEAKDIGTTKPRPVKLIDIDQTLPAQQRSFPAKIYASQQAELAFRIGGELNNLKLIEGQRVHKGEVLSELDKRDAQNALLTAEANYELASADFKRKQSLLDRKLISPAEVDSARATLKSAEASLRTQRDQLQYTSIYAPFSGIVAKVHTDNYQMVQPHQAIVTLQNTDSFELTFELPEAMLNRIQRLSSLPQTQAYVDLSKLGLDQPLPIQYKEHSSLASQGTQTYEVTFSLTPPEGLTLLPGMSSSVLINLPEVHTSHTPIAILPLSALVREGHSLTHNGNTEASVWVYQQDKQSLKRQTVILGNILADGVEVISGLNQGDRVVASGVNSLTGNETIKPLHWVRGV